MINRNFLKKNKATFLLFMATVAFSSLPREEGIVYKEAGILSWFLNKTKGLKNSTPVGLELLCKQKPNADKIIVFKDDEAKQCDENSGISPKKQAQELERAGIKVFKYLKSYLSTRWPAVCGGRTSSINAFYISPEKKSEALALGFEACS